MVHGGTRWVTTTATIGLAAVLVFLGGFGLWSAVRSREAATSLLHSRQLTHAYQQARYAMDDERLLEHRYLIGHGGNYSPAKNAAIHRQFDSIATRVDLALVQVRNTGAREDRDLAGQLTMAQMAYHETTDQVFTSARMGNGGMARMHGTVADREFQTLRDQMTALGDAHEAAALASLASLEQTETGIQHATIYVIPLAVVLFAAFALVLRSVRRREEELTRVELSRLEQQALVDNLTQLRNHRAFEEDLQRDIARADRSGQPLCLVMLDLDGLKQTNDALGHQAGDERLQALAKAMQRAARNSDVAFRVAGDEFALILTDSRAMGGVEAAQRVQHELRRAGDGRRLVTAGVAEGGPGVGRDELVRKADLALIEAKRASRSVLVYGLEMEHAEPGHELDVGLVELTTVASALARAVDAKDSLTRSHSETVAELCALLGTELGLDAEAITKLRFAGLLHDVGKIGIPDAILNNPNRLSTEEYEAMKAHPAVGHGIVSATGLSDQATWILHHHERIDGLGYPDGLTGEEIPLQSRIILVADAFEALTADRPYRARRSVVDALAELRAHAGTQFDARCVDAMASVLEGRASATGLASAAT